MKLFQNFSVRAVARVVKPMLQRGKCTSGINGPRAGHLQFRRTCNTGFSGTQHISLTAEMLTKQPQEPIPCQFVTSSPLLLFPYSASKTFSLASPSKLQDVSSFSLATRNSVLLPELSTSKEMIDPIVLINESSIGDNPDVIGAIVPRDIGYKNTGEMVASSVLKKRKKKMNKHKYKKRRARDKFKRLNLQNIKDRKQRVKDRAMERMKSSA